jgi:DNA/RNA-binding domain of Phe-tRNA-synthetase-like protein
VAPATSPPSPIPLSLDPEVRGKVRLGMIVAAPVSVGPSGGDLLGEMDRIASSLAAEHAGRQPGQIPGLGPARDLYRAFGVDPTHTRPSSEALLRRVIQGKPLPRILNAVDICTLCSLGFLLSIGLYDAAKIRGAVTLRSGRQGEAYPGIRKEAVNLEGRLTLADEEGAFGNPSSDSLRTCVEEATRSLWMVIFAPASYPMQDLEAHALSAARTMERHLAPSGDVVMTSVTVL